MASASFTLFIIVAALLVIALTVLWIALPFAVFGIKKRLEVLTLIQRRQERYLESLERKAHQGKESES